MSIRRLLGTAAAMAVAAAGLRAVTPDLTGVTVAGPDLQRAVDTAGAETVLLAGVAVLAWAVWLWGALGLTLTALSALPGFAGTLAGAPTPPPLLAACAIPPGAPPPAVAVASAQGPAAPPSGPVADWPAPHPAPRDPAQVP